MNTAPGSQGFFKQPPLQIRSVLAMNLLLGMRQHTPERSSFSSRHMPPSLTETDYWRNIIAAKSLGEFAPEEILQLYDTRNDKTDYFIQRSLEWHLSDCVELYCRADDDPSSGGERISIARLIIAIAIMDPESSDGIELRDDFNGMLQSALDRAVGRERTYRRRLVDFHKRPPDSDDAEDENNVAIAEKQIERAPIESMRAELLDAKNRILSEKHPARRLARVMTIQGFTQAEISEATGYSTKQVGRWQNEFEIEATQPDAGKM